MWKAFRNSTLKEGNAPQARIIYDKFHVLSHLGKAMDEVRKREYARLSGKDRRFIKGQRYTLLSRWENLTTEGRQALKLLFKANKRLHTAYLLKESFGQLWDYNRPGWARRFFDHWRDALKWQRLEPFQKFAAMVESHWDGIEAYCHEENKVASGLRRGPQQQDPRHPAARLRLPRRGVPPAEDPHLHAAETLKTTHTIPRRAEFPDLLLKVRRLIRQSAGPT